MFPDELETAFAECPVAWLPYGLCEPHGPQNAVGMDAIRAHEYLLRAAASFGGIVAPRSTGTAMKPAALRGGRTS
jgi:creatinine amidohydrolase